MATDLTLGPADALIGVDVQQDFCPGGALAVRAGDQVVGPLNALAARCATVVATRDWHPADHCSFAAQGGPWPPHCVQQTPGAAYHPALRWPAATIHVVKAEAAERDCFDGFSGRPDLAAVLRQRGVERVLVGGLATDYCVLQTVLGALRAGFAVVALVDAMRAVEVQPGDGQRALAAMQAAGARLSRSSEIG
ncbi:MAG: isochorismatase family protein [Fimbriimonadaceae bacterium]|nr:isochorismatase family protein [Fimbriimonadaceae bacterium]